MSLPVTASTSQLAPIFAGEFRHAMDSKNRITIPSRWRKDEADEFFVVPGTGEGSLLAFPPDEFRRMGVKADESPDLSSAEKAIFKRKFFSKAQHCVTDKQGRMVLPEEHCRTVGISKETVLVGSLTRFEIWSPEKWDGISSTDDPVYGGVANMMGL